MTYPDQDHMTLYLEHHQNQENHFQLLGHVLVHNGLCLINLFLYTKIIPSATATLLKNLPWLNNALQKWSTARIKFEEAFVSN